MSKNYQQVALVTGAARGIGEATAEKFVEEGIKVVATDILPEIKHLNKANVITLTHDVSKAESWASILEDVKSRFGRLDILVNNAGIVSSLDITAVTVEAWQRLMSINLTGVMLGCQMAIALMRENPGGTGGSIINTASSTSFLAIPDVAYTTSKAGVEWRSGKEGHA